MNMVPHPLLFNPLSKDYLWGGSRIPALYSRPGAPARCAESWEIAAHTDGDTTVLHGPLAGRTLSDLTALYGAALVGTRAPDPLRFPLLFKLIDAHEKLSVQVHPSNANAERTNGEPKTEMWYLLDPTMEFRTSGLQNVRTSELQNVRTSELQNVRTSELQNVRTSELQNVRTSDLQNFRTSELQNFRTSELQNVRTSELQNFGTSGLQNVRTSELQNVRTSGLQNVRTSELQNFRTSPPSLYAGFRPGITPDALRAALGDNTVGQCLAELRAAPGGALFIPGGLVHAIGEGCLIYEVQQNSNTTYRLYDWDRLGAQGKPRRLHIEQSFQSIDWTLPPPVVTLPTETRKTAGATWSDIVSCDYFKVRKLALSGKETIPVDGTTFHALFVERGDAAVEAGDVRYALPPGTSCLIPASALRYTLTGNATLLVTTL